MLPAGLYTPLYHHAMLLVVFGCALVYWAGQSQAGSLTLFNQVAMGVFGIGVLVFIGFRPVSWVFVDMPNYAWAYELIQQGREATYRDWLFNGLMRLCAPFLPTAGFIFLCALIYVAPLALASWRVHGAWAFPVFLAFLTAMSFWAYGVNGIRNGMATSVLLLAFAFYEKPVVMLALMAAASGFHGAVLLPAGAFLIVWFVKRTEIWLAFWGMCVAVTLFAGNVGEMLLSRYNPFSWDNRVESYLLGSQGGGFRADFLAYSILPIIATLLMAAPSRARARCLVAPMKSSPASSWMGQRSTMVATRMGMGRLFAVQGASPMRSLALAGFGPISSTPRSPLPASNLQPSTFNLQPSGQLSTRERSSAWNRLPWVRFLRSDPFYARLVNTYLLSNAVWVLLIHASFSNRFAYLSWFMMPWVLLYPFVPGKVIHRPRTGLIAAILCAHYLFTYVMVMVVYRLRGLL